MYYEEVKSSKNSWKDIRVNVSELTFLVEASEQNCCYAGMQLSGFTVDQWLRPVDRCSGVTLCRNLYAKIASSICRLDDKARGVDHEASLDYSHH